MQLKDIGIIIARKKLKENSVIITIFTKNHGLYSGVANENSKKSKAIYHEGNLVDFLWQARLHEHIGTAKCELIKSYNGFLITHKTKLYAFNSIISLIKIAFQERENHSNFFSIFIEYLDKLIMGFSIEDYIQFELTLLSAAGYGLELTRCAVTGEYENLHYVSPKSGIAVCSKVGLPYKDKLLTLPQFMVYSNAQVTKTTILQAFDLTSYFFNRYFFHNSMPPHARTVFIEHIVGLYPHSNVN